MKTVWKYKVKIGVNNEYQIPENSKILHVGIDGSGNYCVWVEILNTKRPKIPINFLIHGTGHEIGHAYDYAGTIIDNSLVWHIYYITDLASIRK